MCTTCGCGEGNLYIEGDEHNPHSAFRSAPFAPAARPKMKITGIKAPEFTPSQTEEGDLHYGHGEALIWFAAAAWRKVVNCTSKNKRPNAGVKHANSM